MAIAYRFIDGGYLEQQDPDGSWSVHKLTGAEKALFDTKVARWFPLALENEQRTGVPATITEAIIYSESAGKPEAEGPASDHGLGLMMITAQGLKQGLSDAEVLVPENNVRLGTDFLATLAAKLGAYDPVRMASMFNAGANGNSPWTGTQYPWGYREYRIPSTGEYPYISKVVRAYNYAIDYLASNDPQPSSVGSVLTKIAAVLGGSAVLGLAFMIGSKLGARR